MSTNGLKMPHKYFHTDATDAVIRDAYRRFREYKTREAIKGAAVKLGWPRYAILQRAKQLTLSRTKEKPWSDAEERLLDKHSGLSVAVIWRKLRVAGFHRTETAINLKMKRNKVRETPNYYSAHQLATYFGIDDHKITLWIKAGFLNAGKKGTLRNGAQGGDTFAIHRDDIRTFILHHPEEIELGGVEKFWFLDIVSGGKLCAEFLREAA